MNLLDKRDIVGKEFVDKMRIIEEKLWARQKREILKFDKKVKALRKKGWSDEDEKNYQDKIISPIGSTTEIGSDSHQDMLADRLSKQKYRR